jgi:outer membrane protein assembly factor BamB
MKRRAFVTSLMAGAGAVSCQNLFGEETPRQWTSWRGTDRDGVVRGTDWPQTLDESRLSLLWTQELGDSYSGPITAENLVVTTESRAGKESTIAFSLDSGEQVWTQTWKGSMNVPFFAARNGNWIRATPATDGKSVYIGGIRDVLVALDVKTGAERWRIDFAEKFGKVPDFGMVCSPVVDGGFLYIQAGKGFHKINCSSGEIIWSTLQDSGDIMSSGAFSSPMITELNGVRQILVQTRTTLAGVDMSKGDVLWRCGIEAFRGMNILTPTVWNNCVFTSSYGGKSLLIDVSTASQPKNVWENKIEGYMSSPVVIDNFLYMHLRNKRFTCIDLSTGKEKWVTKPFGEYWSLVSNGAMILALDQTGDLRLIAHNPEEFTVLSERKVSKEDEEAWAHIAVVPEKIIVRAQKHLSVYRWA